MKGADGTDLCIVVRPFQLSTTERSEKRNKTFRQIGDESREKRTRNLHREAMGSSWVGSAAPAATAGADIADAAAQARLLRPLSRQDHDDDDGEEEETPHVH